MAGASYSSIIDWMDTALNPDLFVLPSQNIVVRTIRFPATMAPELSAVPGVERVQMVRDARIVFRGTPIMVVAVEIESIAQTARRRPVSGDENEMYRLTAQGRGLMVSDNLARLQHLTLGEVIEIPAPNGVIKLPIAGIVVDYSDQQGAILMDRTVFNEYWHDDSVNIFRVYFRQRAWVKWYETFGVNCSKNFNRTSRHLLYFTKSESDFTRSNRAATSGQFTMFQNASTQSFFTFLYCR